MATEPVSLTELRVQTSELLREEAKVSRENSRRQSPQATMVAMNLCDLFVVIHNDPRYPNSEMLQGAATRIRRRLIQVKQSREASLNRNGITRPSGLSSQVDALLTGDTANLAGSAGGVLGEAEGWGLVELIQRIIAPDFWDVRGGNGAMQYFAMQKVLVVRATSDVHEQIRDLLTALR
ncbi:hypothetical protein [Rubripirellula reticaptiva]|uniref:Uncharacterized protein n=1 Tax=Rubripirellula reticaptiva TaxID=2528013 RepID=A0A5C6EIP2_9BACT|nr:hypothetical protein [Rubripirellula reticaptiva]TWU47129.1 hypothetical protein Poly59_61030 [Rubripirellula reticaptiva]